MDLLFQILIREMPNIQGLEKHQEKFFWGGEFHLQEPIKYKWGFHVELVMSKLQTHIPEILTENGVSGQWLVLDIKGDGLALWESEINGVEIDWVSGRIDDFLRLLLSSCASWVLIFEPYYDQLDYIYHLNLDSCINKLEANLKWDNKREGFICIGNS